MGDGTAAFPEDQHTLSDITEAQFKGVYTL